ncbi:transposase family protein [Streptomyces sp. NPDC006617]|uniref:transposase family protein n=1 Tax=Streptomyces sp. NPDC006617 TaxID=3155354 RepID=UPI0033BFACFB
MRWWRKGQAASGLCPDCGRFSDRVHDRYQCRLKDLPLAEQSFVIRRTVRRFICGAADSGAGRLLNRPPGRAPRTHSSYSPRATHAGRSPGTWAGGSTPSDATCAP